MLKIITDRRCTSYSQLGHPEAPLRVARSARILRGQKELPLAWGEPGPANEEAILRAHSPELVARLDTHRGDFDTDTPWYEGINTYARASVGAALEALRCARAGETAFSLMRPPGHHATRERIMGFCYLNSIAITVLEALATGTKRIAVYDFDVHHGNGTEDILLNRDGAAFFSIHQSPAYPDSGLAHRGNNCFNYPVAPATPREKYRQVLAEALDELKQFKPEIVAVSAGFDAFSNDPLAQETLEPEDYHWLGKSIRELGIPAFSVLEGGYSRELPDLIFAYLKGLAGT